MTNFDSSDEVGEMTNLSTIHKVGQITNLISRDEVGEMTNISTMHKVG